MALNNVTTAISDGGSGGGNFDLNIDAEKFYYGYKIVENNFKHLIIYQMLFYLLLLKLIHLE